jgi:hypothetical protein
MNIPSLEKLKTEQCSLEELQAAVVQIIELHNGLVSEIDRLKQSGRILDTQAARDNRRYGL